LGKEGRKMERKERWRVMGNGREARRDETRREADK
jgi:hypothetical protein